MRHWPVAISTLQPASHPSIACRSHAATSRIIRGVPKYVCGCAILSVMNATHSSQREHFRDLYRGRPPWDVGYVQQPFVEVADHIHGTVLEPGCGTGENLLYFAARGCSATGVDFVEAAIDIARRKAADRKLAAEFLVLDALHLEQLDKNFDHVLDCGLFHTFDDADRQAYVASLGRVAATGTRLWLMCFSDKEPPGFGPRRITRRELHDAFRDEWQVESIIDTHFASTEEHASKFADRTGPRAYFAQILRL